MFARGSPCALPALTWQLTQIASAPSAIEHRVLLVEFRCVRRRRSASHLAHASRLDVRPLLRTMRWRVLLKLCQI